jgi:predicted MFS family arabinose efflux permease
VAEPALQHSHLRLVGLAAFCVMAAMRCGDPMLQPLASQFGRTVGDASFVVSAFAVCYGVSQLGYGPLGDRIGKLRVIALATAGCAATSALAGLAWSLDALVLARGLMGATAAGVIPLAMAWIGDSVSYAQRQETLARLLGSTVSGMIAGQWLGALFTELLGWRFVFGVLAALFAAPAWPLWRAARSTPALAAASPPTPSRRLIFRLLASARVRWILCATAIEGALMFGVLAFAPSFLAQRHGLGTAAAGATIALFGVGGLLYSRLAKLLLRRFQERGLAAGGGMLVGASLLTLGWADHWLAVAPACLLAGGGFYMLHATLQTRATQMAPESRGTSMAWFACVLFLGQSAGILAMSLAIDRGLAAQAIGACGAGLIALGLLVARHAAACTPRTPAPT